MYPTFCSSGHVNEKGKAAVNKIHLSATPSLAFANNKREKIAKVLPVSFPYFPFSPFSFPICSFATSISSWEMRCRTEERVISSEEMRCRTEEIVISSEEIHFRTEEIVISSEEMHFSREEIVISSEETHCRKEETAISSEEIFISKVEIGEVKPGCAVFGLVAVTVLKVYAFAPYAESLIKEEKTLVLVNAYSNTTLLT